MLWHASGVVGFAARYFFDAELGAQRRREAALWIERRARVVWSRSRERLGFGAPAAAASPQPRPPTPAPRTPAPSTPGARTQDDEGAEDDLASTLRREVAVVALDARSPEPVDEVAVPTSVRAPAPPREEADRRVSEEAAAPARVLLHLEPTTRQPPRIITYDEESAPEGPPVHAAPVAARREPESRPLRLGLFAAVLVAALAGLGAAVLGVWLLWPEDESRRVGAEPVASSALAVVSQPGARGMRVSGSNGTIVLVVAPDRRAVLVVSGLAEAPPGKQYQAWVVDGPTPESAGLFRGGAARQLVPLRRRVPKGAVFAVTLEQAGGAQAPTQAPKYVITAS